MAFWGVEVKSSKPYSHRLDSSRGRLHISQATLGIGSSLQRSLLQCNVGDKSPVYLCSLLPDKAESCPLNLQFEEEDEVIFSVLGPRSVHLSGFYIDKSANADGDQTDSYGEDIGETGSDHSTDYGTEDDYQDDDDFIHDTDDEMFSPSPRHNSRVVIEEIVDGVEPVNRNGCRRRLKRKYQASDSEDDDLKRKCQVSDSEDDDLKKKYQVSDSEDDDLKRKYQVTDSEDDDLKRKYQVSDSEDDDQKQITFRGGSSDVESESNDIDDALPISFLLETKDESAEIQDKPETVSKEEETAQGVDQVISAERENEHVQASTTYRGLGTTNDSTLPSSEAGQENVGKPKKKKKKDGTNEEKPRRAVSDSIIAVHKEDESQMEGAKTDNITHGGPVRDEANVNPSKDKGLGTTNDSTLPAVEIGQENVEMPKMKKTKEGLNEENVRGVVGDCSVDVHKGDNSQTKEAKVDDVSEEEPVRDVDEKPSNDKGLGTTNDSTVPAFEVEQENVEMPKMKKKKEGLNEENIRGVVGDCSVDVHKEDNSQTNEAKVDDITEEEPVRDVDEKPSNDKGLRTTNDSTLPAFEIGQENVEKPKMKKKKEGLNEEKLHGVVGDCSVDVHTEDKSHTKEVKVDDITEEEHVRDVDEKPSNDKGLGTTNDSTLPAFEIGQENVEKPKKRKKKEGINEEKVCGVVGDCNVDVHKEDKSQTKEAKVDDMTEEEPVRDVDEKPSNDKGFEKTYGSALLAPEVGQEKAEKQKRKKKKLRTTEEKTERVLVGDDIVHNEDKSQVVEAKADSIAQEDPIRDEADEKPSNDKGFEKTYGSDLLAPEVGQEKAEKPKRKKKKLRTTEEKTERVLVGDDIVHNEDRSLVVEAKADSIAQEDPVRDEADEKPSNDKGVEKTYGSDLLAPEVGQEKAEKPKRKKKKLRTTEEKTERVLVGDIVHNEDRSQVVEAKADSIAQEDPVREEADEKPSNDKAFGNPNESFPFYETGQENAEKPKKKKKKGGKAQLEEAKADVLVNVHKEDKSLMEEAKAADISQEVFPVRDEAEKKTPNDNLFCISSGIEKPHDSSLPSSEILPETTEKPKKMKKKKSTKEGKTRGVANNDVLDVQKEDKLQMEEAKADFIIQKDPVSSKADKKSSTDKVAEIDACHVVEEDSSERKKRRKKNKKKTPDMDGNVIMEEAKEGLIVEIEDGKSVRKTTRKRS